MKIRRSLLTLLALCLLLPVLAVQTMAATDSGDAGDNVKWTLDNQGTLTISGSGEMTGAPWLTDYKTVIKKVVIEEGVTSIAYSAFNGCTSLTEVTIPETVIKINSLAFSECGLENLIFPAHVQSFGSSPFRWVNLENLYITDIENYLAQSAGTMSFTAKNLYVDGELITDLVIPEGTTKIASYAFDNVSSLESVTIPGSVTTIEEYAFEGCENLKKVTIVDGNQTIERYAFYECKNLVDVKLPSTLNAIQSYAFAGCGFTEFTIPTGVQVINSNAFQFYWGWNESSPLSVLKFLGNAPQIAEDGLSGITATAYYSPNNASWTEDKFKNYGGNITWEADTSISGGDASGEVAIVDSGNCGDHASWTLYSDGKLTISGSGEMASAPWLTDYKTVIKKVVIEEGVTSIAYSAFNGCTSLTEVTIPETVIKINSLAFSECGLENLIFPAHVQSFGSSPFRWVNLENLYITDIENYLAQSAGTMSFTARNLYIDGELVTDLVIPEGTTKIASYAFDNVSSLESVTIPGSVTTIEEYAFEGCENLKKVTIADGNQTIERYAFYECKNLVEVNLPSTLNAIQSYAFAGCGFTEFTIPTGVQVINSNAFQFYWGWNESSPLSVLKFLGNAPLIATDGLTGITATAYYSSANQSWTADKLQNYGGTITWVADDSIPGSDATGEIVEVESGSCGDHASWTLYSDGKLTISGTGEMTSAPWLTDYKTVIKKVVIEEGVTSIAYSAFNGCTSLTEVTIPETVIKINSLAFSECGLENLIFPAHVQSFGSSPFRWVNLENLYITDIENYLAQSAGTMSFTAKNLYVDGELITDLVIPEGTTKIASYAFDNVSSLESVTIPGSVTTIEEYAFEGCENLKKVAIADGNQTIERYAFYECKNLVEVNLPSTLNAIQSYAFAGCGFTEFTIPTGVQVINSNAFQFYWGWNESSPLSVLKFLGDAPLIASDGFTGITATARYSSSNASWTSDKLQNYGGTITWVADDNISDTGGSAGVYIIAEGYCGSNVYYVIYSNGEANIKTVASYALRSAVSYDMDDYASPEDAPWYPYRDQIKTLTIEEGVTSIGDNAFAGCENLTEVIIQDGVADIGSGAFQSCESLTEVTFQGSAPSFGENAFAEVEATVNFPAGDESWNEEVAEEMGGQIELKPDENLHAHNYEQVVTPPTCTEQGYTTYTCACGKTYEDDFVDPVAHSYGVPAYSWAQDNSCVAEFTCTACENKQSVDCKVVSTPVEGGTLYVATVEFGGKSYFDSRTVADESGILWGDVNGDGWVDSFDASLIMKYDVMLIGDNDLTLAAADVSGDGYVDSYDASLILKFDVMLIEKFPVEE